MEDWRIDGGDEEEIVSRILKHEGENARHSLLQRDPNSIPNPNPKPNSKPSLTLLIANLNLIGCSNV